MSDLRSTPSPSNSASPLATPPPRTPPNLHQNTVDPSAKWIVQKFGGTSIGKFAVTIAQDIVSDYIDRHKVVLVCSARSGSNKALGTTSLLLQASAEALRRKKFDAHSFTPGYTTPVRDGSLSKSHSSDDGDRSPDRGSRQSTSGPSSPFHSTSLSFGFSPISQEQPLSFSPTVDLIRSEHLNAARSSIQDSVLLTELEAEIERDCDWLRSFLFAAQVIDEISARSKDTIIGFGERLSCKLMTTILRDRGVDAEYVSLESVVPELDDELDYNRVSLPQDYYDSVSVALAARVQQCGSRVPVVTGFFGPVPGSLLRHVGRGYTDLCAALLAAGLDAAELQIWKEVDGIFTADPRKVMTARLIPIISPEEAAELTYYGSEVVHPFTMEQAIRRKIPIRIKNVENPKGSGTVIHPNSDLDASEYDVVTLPEPVSLAMLSMLSLADHGHKKLPTAVTIKENIVVLNVNSNRKSVSHGFLAGIFGTLDRFGIIVDLISTSEVHVSMAIEDRLDKKILVRILKDLEKSGSVTVHKGMAILSLVGKLKNMVGISGRMFTSLAQGNVNIEMISQGANEVNISCVIDGKDAVKALNLIHQSCLQIRMEERVHAGPWLF